MKQIQNMKFLVAGVFGLFCFAASAETYPEPEKRSVVAVDAGQEKADLIGKVVKVEFNRISLIHKVKDGVYGGDLRSRSKPEESGDWEIFSDDPGVVVQFSAEGLGVLSKFIPEVGGGRNDVTPLGNSDDGKVYVLIGDRVSTALGDRYGGGGEYVWSKKNKMPDLSDAKKVSVTDLLLYPEQLSGKTFELEFYYAEDLKKGSPCTVLVSSALFGHRGVSVDFPPDGMEFFQEAVDQDDAILRARTVFATVDVSSSGKISVKALGRRQQGKGEDAVYKW